MLLLVFQLELEAQSDAGLNVEHVAEAKVVGCDEGKPGRIRDARNRGGTIVLMIARNGTMVTITNEDIISLRCLTAQTDCADNI